MQALDFFVDEDRARVEKEIRKTFRIGESLVEAHFLSKHDQRRPTHYLTGFCPTIEGKRYLAGMGFDISELRQAQSTLRDSEQRYRPFFEEDRSAAFITKPDG
jgi:hypothetical protein